MEKARLKENFEKSIKFLTQKKVLNIIVLVLFLVLLVGSSYVRLQNLSLLKDTTTDEYIPLALDPFYFLRLAETLLENGEYPEYDNMRYPSLKVGFHREILPQTIVLMYKILNTINSDLSIQFVNVISPVIFFALSLIVFFFLVYFLTNSKITALISSAFLGFIPLFLYRTMAGFSDHEAIGILGFFLAMLSYTISLKFLNKNLKKTIGFGILTGLFTAFTLASWGGIVGFLYIIIPLSFGIIWFVKSQKSENKKELFNYVIFYLSWFVFSLLISVLFGYELKYTLQGFILTVNGIISLFILGLVIVDYVLIHYKKKIKKFYNLRIIWSLIITIILGFIILFILGQNPFEMIIGILEKLLTPFGTERIALTVAENKQPFLTDWINQSGKTFFWLFYLGMIFIGFNFSKGIKKHKNKISFIVIWIIMISGVLFSRISSSSILNGENFISKSIYFLCMLVFVVYSIWLYFNDELTIKNELSIIMSWTFITLIAARGAIRMFFITAPLMCFIGGYAVLNLYNYFKKNKEDLAKKLLLLGFVLSLLIVVFNIWYFANSVSMQAKYTSPSANEQWQSAMQWVRNNTMQGEIFVHWWDYGYWVEYLGQRPSVTDGGHANGFWDHLIGRYVLTTPNPETALSFMKAHNVSYLLIDPTDIGKYPAYSSIGNDEEDNDRYSFILPMLLVPEQTIETRNSTTRIYQGGGIPLDKDIVYKDGEKTIFLPEEKAFIIGIMVETTDIGFKKPYAIFIYNQNQIRIPLRYIYYDKQIYDFKEGINATVIIMPSLIQSNQGGVQTQNMGAVLYLSPKNMNSLFSEVYLMDNAFGNYDSLELVHSEDDFTSIFVGMQKINSDFVYYNGVRGPIKIWKFKGDDNIIARDEFLRESGDYGEFDDLEFVK
jgi:asparagine N-glycosylation enzyme membrane subunit Stt3